MSRQLPAEDTTDPAASLTSAPAISPRQALPTDVIVPEDPPRQMLDSILSQALSHLVAENSKTHPKSIYTKASDIARNLPHWRNKVDATFMSVCALDLSEELQVYTDVLEAANATINKLRHLVANKIRESSVAEEEWGVILRNIRSALGRLRHEFGASHETKTGPTDRSLT